MTKVKFDRPIDFSYNADLNSITKTLHQLADYIEAHDGEVEKLEATVKALTTKVTKLEKAAKPKK